MNVKEWYRVNDLQDEIIRPVNHRVVEECMKFNPKSVFEFGCNNGKNLTLFPKEVKLCGIDVNPDVLKHPCTHVGDEKYLEYFIDNAFDVVFTCSVLNHIPFIEDIVRDLKRISKHTVSIEYSKHEDERWFIHNYARLGFKKVDSISCLFRMYDIWIVK